MVLLGWLPSCPRATPTTGGGGPPWPEPVWRLVAQNSAIPVPPSACRKIYFYLHSWLNFNHRFLLVKCKSASGQINKSSEAETNTNGKERTTKQQGACRAGKENAAPNPRPSERGMSRLQKPPGPALPARRTRRSPSPRAFKSRRRWERDFS